MAAGSIVISLLLATGSFETDTARAEKRLKAFQKQAEGVGKAIGVTLVAGATAAAAAFQLLVSSAAEFKDLEEQTGATAEDLASLSTAAAVAGTSVADIAGQANKLTKNLAGVDDESKAAGAALTALGIPIADFKKLDPVGQIDALTKGFGNFADGSEKTAVAMALFGKSGASMLNVFKELEGAGGRQVILTQQQIELADEYSDRQSRQVSTIKQYAQSAATDLLPALNDLTAVAKEVIAEFTGIDSSGKKLAGDSPVKEFADKAVDVLAFLIDSAQGVSRVFETIGLYIGGTAATMAAILSGEFGQAKTIAEEARADIEKVLSAEMFSQRLARLRAVGAAAASNTAAPAPPPPKPRLQPNGPADQSKKAKVQKTDQQTEAERYLESLDRQLDKTKDLTIVEHALADIQAKRISGLTPALTGEILARAEMLDLIKRSTEFRDGEIEVTTKLAKAQLADLEAIEKGNVELQHEIELLGLNAEQLAAVELQKVRVTRAEKESTLAKLEATGVDEKQLQVLQAEIEALTMRERLLGDKANKTADIAARDGAEKVDGDALRLRDSLDANLGDAFGDFVTGSKSAGDAFKRFSNSVIKDLLRIQAQKLAMEAISGAGGGWGALIGMFGSLFGLSSSGAGISDVGGNNAGMPAYGLATGTNYVPHDNFPARLHRGEAVIPREFNPAAGGKMPSSGGGVTIINQSSARVRPAGNDSQGNPKIIVEEVVEAAQARSAADFASGTGPQSTALRQRFGLGAGNLPKRG